MKKIIYSIFLVLAYSCGEYVEKKIELDEPQVTAIQNFLTQECITKNAELFTQLGINTADWANADIDDNFFYEFNTTNKDPKKIAFLKRTETLMYIYVESTDPEIPNRVYKYTTTDNANHINNIKSYSCAVNSTFTGDATLYNYVPVSSTPNSTDPGRTTYSSSYNVRGNRPVFFSLFSRKYTRTIYEEDEVKTTDTVEVTFNITKDGFDLDNEAVRATYKNLFNGAEHCVFNSVTPAWLSANFPDTFGDSVTCTRAVFDWDTDIITE